MSREFDYWVYVPEWGVAVASPPKCASRSVTITIIKHFYPEQTYETARPSEYKKKTEFYRWMNKADVDPNWPKLAIVRNPIDRFASLWAHHCRDDMPGIPVKLRGGAKMDVLLERIKLTPYQNAHWAPQSYIIGEHKNIRYCDLSKARKAWAKIMPRNTPPLAHVNRTARPVPVPAEIKAELRQLYAADFELIQ